MNQLVNLAYSIIAIVLCLAIGKGLNSLFTLLPGSLYGMIIFTAMLKLGLVKAERVKASVLWLIRNMGVCFVPAGVGAIHYLDLLATQGPVIILMIFITTMALMAAVGLVTEKLLSDSSKRVKGSRDEQ